MRSSIYKNRLMRFFVFLILLELSCVYKPIIKGEDERPETRVLNLDITKYDSSPGIAKIVTPKLNTKYCGKYKVTFYWIIEESDYSGSKTTALYLENGNVLGYFPAKFVRDLKKESCAELKDGRRISYLKRVNKVRVVKEFLGIGGYTLTPFVSVATDPDYIPTGSKIYIPQLANIDRAVLAGAQSVEDQCIVYAHDIGAMINNHHIDFFVGYKQNTKLFTDAGIESSSLVDVYLFE